MGQRTQIVVKVIEDKSASYFNEKPDIHTHSAVYHNQWGFAKMQLFDVINLLNTYIPYEGWSMPERLHKAFLDKDVAIREEASVEEAAHIFNKVADNNNGGVYVELIVKDRYIQEGKLVLFSDPEAEYKDDEDYVWEARPYISLLQYIKYHRRYFDKDFYRMFLATLKFYNIKLITKGE